MTAAPATAVTLVAEVVELLDAARASDRVFPAARAALAQSEPEAACPTYFAALETAIREAPPPFDTAAYADVYHRASEHATWMAVSLITNAEREGDGAKRLWSLAACSTDPELQGLLKRHAVDESRHALMYLAMLDLVFPAAVDPAFRAELNALSPRFSLRQEPAPVPGSPYAKSPTIDDFMQMNIAEIRTTIHHLMQRVAMARHCPPEAMARLTAIQDSLLRDELKHVAYTAVLIERLGAGLSSERVVALFGQRLRDFNRITLEELGEGVFD